jgi:predicted Zn finger-like uncharacterized protein
MIIQCDQCQTKFKLDDSKVADKSIKVRCATCRHVFSVAQAQPAPEETVALWQDETELPTEAEQEFEAPLHELEPEAEPESSLQEDASSETAGGIDFGDFAMPEEADATPSAADENDDEGFTFPSAERDDSQQQEKSEETAEEMDFGSFDFSDAESEEAPTIDLGDAPVNQAPPAAPAQKEFGGLDFSGDDMFGEVVSPIPVEESKESISFDMGMDGFADSMGVESGSDGQGLSAAAKDTTETPFSLDDIDFGDELTSVAVQQVSTEELKPSQELLFAPLAAAETQAAPFMAEEPPAQPAAAQEAPAAPAIASRRKDGPRISGMLLLLWVMIASLVIFYSYWGIKTLTESKGTIEAKEDGKITLRSVEASYVKNKKLGTLLVITGEAVNEYNKPRASIQVKGIVFGADGEEVDSRTAYCGNPLSEQQLATMSMDKIEAAMANQFGDSLANMEVAAGDSIPFVIVIPKPAKEATDYGVEPAGSTGTTDKEDKK